MRASAQPLCARNAPSTSAIMGSRAMAAGSRSLPSPASHSSSVDGAISPSGSGNGDDAGTAVVSRARHYGAIATDALALFPASTMKQALEEAVEFCISRTH